MGERADQLRRALAEELPSITFGDEVVEYLVCAVEDWAQASEDKVTEEWSPFLMSHNAVPDEEGAREVCQRLLARLRRVNGGVAGLREWMERRRLPLAKYPHAQAWCQREGISTMSGIMDRAEKFCDALQLKMLEKKRVLDDASRATLAGPAQDVQPEAQPLTAPGRTEANRPCTSGTFGRAYDIGEQLGEGAFAKVHRCVRRATPSQPEEVFAVKIISLRHMQLQQDNSRAMEKMRRETENLLSLRHRNIVALHDSFEYDRHMYLVMELVDGGELFHHIVRGKDGRLSEQAAGFVFRQLAEALTYIHSRQIIHRDLKPENVLVHRGDSRPEEGKLVVKISDFGQSKIIDEGVSIAQTRVGTPQYWAPEVALAAPNADARGYNEKVDHWSLGVVLYVMLEGTYPFDGKGMRVDEQLREAKYRPMVHSSTSAKEIVRGLIQRQPQDRLSLDKCLEHAWLRKLEPDAAVPQVEDEHFEQFSLQVTPTKLQTTQLRQELLAFNKRHKLLTAVLRNGKVTATSSASSGSKEEARSELLGILEPFCPTGPADSAAGHKVAVGAPLAMVSEQ